MEILRCSLVCCSPLSVPSKRGRLEPPPSHHPRSRVGLEKGKGTMTEGFFGKRNGIPDRETERVPQPIGVGIAAMA